MCLLCASFTSSFAASAKVNSGSNFEQFADGHSILQEAAWSGFRGFRGDARPVVKILEARGIDGSKALAIWHTEKFRTDNWGVQYRLPEVCTNGVVWLQCRFMAPAEWTGNLLMDARTEDLRGVLVRIAGGPYSDKSSTEAKLRWHSTWYRAFWRLYTVTESKPDEWRMLTARIDLDARRCATWVDDQPLTEEAPLAAEGGFGAVHLGFGGTEKHPAFIDDLSIGRTAPKSFQAPELLPEPEEGLLFRFAAVGDPQLGFGGYLPDQIRFGLAAEQINRSDAALSLILGDMVHTNRDEQAYRDLVKTAATFAKPVHYVRGNHEDLDLFKKHFHPDANYSFVNGGVRFVVIDAIGKQLGLPDEQLKWIENEFVEANAVGQEIVLSVHVSPWQDNAKGRGAYNQIGPGRDQLRALMKKHRVLLCLSGHYHRALWHQREELTHYLVLPGTAVVSAGGYGWCLFDVYPDRIVMHQKPLFHAYEKKGVQRIHGTRGWLRYPELKEKAAYVQQGPLAMMRHWPVKLP